MNAAHTRIVIDLRAMHFARRQEPKAQFRGEQHAEQ
jgi:hypothetical protein